MPGSSEVSAASFANFSPARMRLRTARIFAFATASAAESGVAGIWITESFTCAGAFGNLSGFALKKASASAAGTLLRGNCFCSRRDEVISRCAASR